MLKSSRIMIAAVGIGLAMPAAAWAQGDQGYASVNGLEMYYEIHGTGRPLVLLAVLPGTTHVTLIDRADWLASMITGFLDAPMPEGE